MGPAAILLGLAVACGSAGQPQETVLPGNDSQQVQQPQLPTRSQAAAGPATGSAATSETSAVTGAASQASQSHESAATGEINTGATEARPAPTAVAVDSPPEPVAAATIGVTSTQEPIAPPTAARGPEPTAAPAPTSTDAPRANGYSRSGGCGTFAGGWEQGRGIAFPTLLWNCLAAILYLRLVWWSKESRLSCSLLPPLEGFALPSCGR